MKDSRRVSIVDGTLVAYEQLSGLSTGRLSEQRLRLAAFDAALQEHFAAKSNLSLSGCNVRRERQGMAAGGAQFLNAGEAIG